MDCYCRYTWSPFGGYEPTQAYLAHRPELKREQMAGEQKTAKNRKIAVEVTFRYLYAHGFVWKCGTSMYIPIYIYVCVCGCVCVCPFLKVQWWLSRGWNGLPVFRQAHEILYWWLLCLNTTMLRYKVSLSNWVRHHLPGCHIPLNHAARIMCIRCIVH